MLLVGRVLVTAGAIFGAIGVAAAASASHLESRNLAAIATIFLAHGPALLALGLHGRGRVLMAGGSLLLLGTMMFGSDLGMREVSQHSLFPAAAPIGGGLMLAGWLVVAIGAWLGSAIKD